MFQRKVIAIIFLLLTVVIATAPSAQAQIANYVVINEFELNPSAADFGLTEFVELYNPTSTSVNIGEWEVTTTRGVVASCGECHLGSEEGLQEFEILTVTVPSGKSIPAKGYYVVCSALTMPWLHNEDNSIILRDAGGNEVDRTPVKSDLDDDANSWQRNPDGGSDWVFQKSTRNAPIPEFPSASIMLAATLLIVLIIMGSQTRLVARRDR